MSRPPSVTLLGTPAHPALTDVPVTLLAGAPLLELAGTLSGRDGLCRAARLAWVGAALAAAPAALAGYLDYERLEGADRGLARRHALLNASALATGLLAAACRASPTRGTRRLGALAALASASLASAGAHVGGELVFHRGIAVDADAVRGGEHADASWTRSAEPARAWD